MSLVLYPFFSVVFFGVMLSADIVQRFCKAINNEKLLAKSVIIQNILVLWSLRLAGVRLQMERSSAMNHEVPVVIVANHQSIFDIPITSVLFKEFLPGFVAKQELGKGSPGASVYLSTSYNALVNRKDVKQATRAIKELAGCIKARKGAVVLFPEGTRSKTGEIGEFKSTGFQVLLRELEEAQVVPVSIDGAWKLARYPKKPIPWGAKVVVKIGQVETVSNKDNLTEKLQNLRNWIKNA